MVNRERRHRGAGHGPLAIQDRKDPYSPRLFGEERKTKGFQRASHQRFSADLRFDHFRLVSGHNKPPGARPPTLRDSGRSWHETATGAQTKIDTPRDHSRAKNYRRFPADFRVRLPKLLRQRLAYGFWMRFRQRLVKGRPPKAKSRASKLFLNKTYHTLAP